MVALEPDPAMAAIATRHAATLDNVDVVVDRFEDWVTAGPRFDAIVAAHCWHWVDPRVGYAKARSLVRDDGSLAAFWNVPVVEASPLAPAIDDAYRRHAPELEDKTATTRSSFSDSLGRHPGFKVRDQREYDWDQVYTAREYADMLCTHSDHHLLPEAERSALIAAVRDVIEDAGGTITLRYETLLVLLEPQ
jgi:SAM-dependent methyltransferase